MNCLGEITEKTCTVQIEKEVTRINKNGEEVTKNISYISQFIDSTRFVASSLSNLVNNLSERIHRIKCKFVHVSDNSNIKILTPKQMLQRLPTEFTQVKAGNGSENLLNEIRQIIYSLYQAKQISNRVYNNIMNSRKL